jgi:RNA polymerase sigma factor (sigma-70 family)
MSDMQQAYDQIIGPIEDLMIRSIWRIVRNPHDAEDAMQDALLTMAKRWDRICKHASPQSLVLKICIDAAYDLTRRTLRKHRTVSLDESHGELTDSVQSPAEEAIAGEQHAEIVAAIHRLPRQQGTAMLMRAVQGQSYESIAAALGCTEATARKHVARSREKLRTWLAHLAPQT